MAAGVGKTGVVHVSPSGFTMKSISNRAVDALMLDFSFRPPVCVPLARVLASWYRPNISDFDG